MIQQNPAIPPSVSMLRRRDVQTQTGLSRSTIYRRVAEGTFPKPVNLGGRTVGWIAAEIQDWLERQIAASRPSAMAAMIPDAVAFAVKRDGSRP